VAYAYYTAWLAGSGEVTAFGDNKARADFDNLKAGSHEVDVAACVDTTQLTGYDAATDGNSKDDADTDALCPTNGTANYSWASNTKYKNSNSAMVYTKPGVVTVSGATRTAKDPGTVTIVKTVDDGGGADLKIEYSTSSDLSTFDAQHVISSDGTISVDAKAASVYFLACTDLGCSPSASNRVDIVTVS
jgi:hypothetical protein